ncbi:hypothetical protein IV38_GL000437 [Lactobacillus selangorensis]|uniref:Uncharacterized protein n=1 Tax=Lactobacillus selangorensis TaxID=81857 RepID=A0A0R2FM16_9LACO|nr:hypothetical protein [Lactobacillus selangorensis]KRN29552.1 hypothetical protein IV38_GL000437 [Lactobacillus selangorensis]KRN33918.1 hypothetical protein IV40_GL000231 [Lactobacillus selangorensis]
MKNFAFWALGITIFLMIFEPLLGLWLTVRRRKRDREDEEALQAKLEMDERNLEVYQSKSPEFWRELL